MTYIPDTVIQQAADVIITTRDFCGDEREAVREWCAENGYKAEWQKVHRIAKFRANAAWNEFQKAAGVNPRHTW
jgi:hypothetical protein